MVKSIFLFSSSLSPCKVKAEGLSGLFIRASFKTVSILLLNFLSSFKNMTWAYSVNTVPPNSFLKFLYNCSKAWLASSFSFISLSLLQIFQREHLPSNYPHHHLLKQELFQLLVNLLLLILPRLKHHH